MANIPISQLSAITAATSTTILPVVEYGNTYKITRDEFIPRAFAQYTLTQDQSLTAGSATTVNIDTVIYENNITIDNNVITFISGGTFLINASYQFSQGSGSSDVAFWFHKDGIEIPESATHQTLSSNSKATAMVSIIQEFPAGETFELKIQSTSNNTIIDTIEASGVIPTAPGLILTINQIY